MANLDEVLCSSCEGGLADYNGDICQGCKWLLDDNEQVDVMVPWAG